MATLRGGIAGWRVLLALLCCVSAVVAVTPEQVPNPRRAGPGWIADLTGVLDQSDRQAINQRIDQLRAVSGAEMAVVVIPDTDGRVPKEFATELLNRWKIGQAGRDNGVLVLLVMNQRRVEVETGYGLEAALPDAKVGEYLRNEAVPYFKRDDYGGGLAVLVLRLAAAISLAAPEGTGRDLAPVGAASTAPGSPAGGLPWLPVGVLVVLGGAGALAARRLWVPKCPKCGGRMSVLSEQAEDLFLDADQQLEERLGSIDYRVWRCAPCDEVRLDPRLKHFSGYDYCPQCTHRTVRAQSRVIDSPTYYSTGTEEVERQCLRSGCGYHDRSQRTLPRLQRRSSIDSGSGFSSGGGGGGFSGGSSGGGGAGASW